MMFREAPARTWPKGHVVHGPFPARLRFFGFAFALSFIGALFTWMALQTQGTRFGFAWIGVSTGCLIGLAVFGITMMVLGWINPRADIEPWMLAYGCGLGAMGGAALVVHYTRTRLPR